MAAINADPRWFWEGTEPDPSRLSSLDPAGTGMKEVYLAYLRFRNATPPPAWLLRRLRAGW
jgi:hypothetical protein